MAYYRCLEGNAAPGPAVEKLKYYSGRINNNTGEVSSDSDYYYSDYFPIGQAMVFNLGSSTNSNIGMTIYDSSKTYMEWWGFNAKYREVNNSSLISDGAAYVRICGKIADINRALAIDLTNLKTYTPLTPIQMEADT